VLAIRELRRVAVRQYGDHAAGPFGRGAVDGRDAAVATVLRTTAACAWPGTSNSAA
jgi:hypothetical protein